MKQNTILVIGGTGKTGRRVARRLAQAGVAVRSVSRSSTVPFDWTDAATWKPAIAGAGAAYITYHPDIALPGAVEAISDLVQLSLAQGVRRLVLLTGRGEDEALRAEETLMSSGADWTIIRASWFMQNFSENFLVDGIVRGEVAFPKGDVPEPFVDADDIADVAAAALTRPGHEGKVYEVTGPRMLSFRQAVGEIAGATGRKIAYVEVSPDEYVAELTRLGTPPDIVELLGILTKEVLDGRNAFVADGVERALHRPPRDFKDYAAAAAATGVWGRAA